MPTLVLKGNVVVNAAVNVRYTQIWLYTLSQKNQTPNIFGITVLKQAFDA